MTRACIALATSVLVACSERSTEPVIMEAPVILAITPDTIDAATPNRTITIRGGGFTRATTVRLDTSARVVTFVRSTELRVQLRDDDLLRTRRAVLVVQKPEPGGGVAVRSVFLLALPTNGRQVAAPQVGSSVPR